MPRPTAKVARPAATPESVRALSDAGDRAGAARMLAELPAADAVTLAGLRARLGTAPPPDSPRAILGQFADFALLHDQPEQLPAEWRPDFDAVRAAFAAHAAGDDAAARSALERVGLRSPFLEWKLLHRALLAHAAGDEAAAQECARRLPADRLPATLAARALDAGASDALAEQLVAVRRDISSTRGLAAAFKKAETLLPALKKRSADYPARLARAFYRAIAHHGEPGDLKKFKKLFGPPADDPEFRRLEAVAWEEAGEFALANDHWLGYERWLAAGSSGWPADVARRARAVILVRVARNAEKVFTDEDELDFLDGLPPGARAVFAEFAGLAGGSGRRKRKTPAVDPVDCLRRARDIAPDWEVPGTLLVVQHAAAGNLEAAEAEAAGVLVAHPRATAVLIPLATQLHKAGRAAEALAAWDRVLAVNPLDRPTRVGASQAALAAARQAAHAGDLAGADALLIRRRELNPDTGHLPPTTLLAVLRLLQKRPADAEAAKAAALEFARHPAGVLAHLTIEAALSKLKPAQRKPWEAEFAAALAGPADPRLAYALLRCLEYYAEEGIDFRGRATLERKMLTVAADCVKADAPLESFEDLVLAFGQRGDWKGVAKFAPALMARFAASPVFPLGVASAEVQKSGRPSRKVFNLLQLAATLAERSANPRHQELLPNIEAMEEQLFGDDYF